MIEVTDEMIEAYGKAWESTAPDEPGARRRAGLEAVFDIVNAQAMVAVNRVQDEYARTWAVDKAIQTLSTSGNSISSSAVTAVAENYFNYVKDNQA
jgi:hypothetical protein